MSHGSNSKGTDHLPLSEITSSHDENEHNFAIHACLVPFEDNQHPTLDFGTQNDVDKNSKSQKDLIKIEDRVSLPPSATHSTHSERQVSDTFVTPRKDNILSPPVVTRRVTDIKTQKSAEKFVPSTLFHSTRKPKSLDSIKNNLSRNALQKNDFYSNHDDDDDKEETSSMISQYGSDAGDVTIRMDDMMTMEAVPECSNDDESEHDRGDDHEENCSELGPYQNPCKDSSSTDDSIASVDLSDTQANVVVETPKNIPIRETNTPSSPFLKSSEASFIKQDTAPTTPIGTVSIALRNIGKGMSHFTKAGGKLSSPLISTSSVASSPRRNDEKNRYCDLNSNRHWLSPRYGNQKVFNNGASIHQPILNNTESSKVKSGASQMFGITQCLSFDPESGKLPYANMRFTESPPASPLPYRAHRKTKSWGGAGFDIPSKANADKSDSSFFFPHTPIPYDNKTMTVPLSPHTADDNERDDAINLLKIFVQQSLMHDFKTTRNEPGSCNDVSRDSAFPLHASQSDLDDTLNDLRRISEGYSGSDLKTSHQLRSSVLNELETAYGYAQEMKRAAISASTWLNFNDKTHFDSVYSQSAVQADMSNDQLKIFIANMQQELSIQVELNQKLNRDLSSCKAEIGRLKTVPILGSNGHDVSYYMLPIFRPLTDLILIVLYFL